MPVNLQRRKSVMSRSMKLGHCVCNPKNPCPCPTFIEHNICPCAGEKMPVKTGAVPLTRYVSKAGCASKIGQADLARVLAKLPAPTDPNVLVGMAAGDDAGVYRLDGDRCLVQTVDVFTPCVDDPYLFGQIAAANSVSDVYAMGGRPLCALSIVGFPIDDLDGAILEEILRGGIDKMNEAGCPVIGGHSINDEEIKCGFAVTGLIAADAVVERAKARAGDALVLTKPLGTGMVSFAAQIGRVRPECLSEAGAWMAALNKDAAELMVRHGARACTDVTGFGLMGHLVEMARGSGLCAEIDMSALPVLAPVLDCLENDILSGAIERNQEYAMAWLRLENPAAERTIPILFDPQTSGGLLIALPETGAAGFIADMRARGHEAVSVIGRMTEPEVGGRDEGIGRRAGEVVVKGEGLENLVGEREGILRKEEKKEEPLMKEEKKMPAAPKPAAEELACCANPPAEELACCANPPAFDAPLVPGEQSGASSEPAPVAPEYVPPASCRHVPPASRRQPDDAPPAAGTGEAERAFAAFMQEANKPGAVGARAKRLMSIALSVAQRCKPCLIIHAEKALEEGISMAEIDEAAWLAISFFGSPSMMFYKEWRKQTGG